MLSDLNCLVIMNDNIQQDIFEGHFFKKLGSVPYYKVLVKEKEDLQSPNYKTLSVIRHVKRAGCQVYILMISNGGKVSRFLKFGDRHRVLDTRAKFILLHDHRLFHSSLHYLWRKIVNVVFLHQQGRHHGSVITRQKIHPWYDISTVPFPSPIDSTFVPLHLDTWHQGKFRSGADLFRKKTSDLRGQQLRVVTFQHLPASVKMASPSLRIDSVVEGNGPVGFGGLEIEVLRTLATVMNFHPDVYEAENADVEQWGRRQLNGSYSGLLGEVMSGQADIALGNLYYTPYYLELIDLTIPYTTECLTFLTPESLTNNSWMTLILPFRPLMWAAVFVALILAGFVFYALANYHIHIVSTAMNLQTNNAIMVQERSKINDSKVIHIQEERNKTGDGLYLFSKLENGILYTYGMLLLISLPKFPSDWSLRVLTGWWWIYCILLVVAYRASMTAILANPTPRVTIDTMEQLVDNHITCGGWGEEIKQFFLTSLDISGQKIGLKFEVIYDTDLAVEKVAKGEFAYYENIYFLQYLRVRRQLIVKEVGTKKDVNTNEESGGNRNLHIMHDCVIHMPVSIGLQKNSPLKPHMDRFLRRIVEAGLIKKWLKDVMLSIVSVDNTDKEDGNKPLMNLQKLYGAFVALGVGYLISICAFAGEKIHWQCVVKKSPLFDKYAINIYYDHQKSSKAIKK
ncbi:glutamate receptor 1 isoform X2 [Zootermopsis nevadensis]|uniref:Uncharacterized protein n=2 Tax=Zootermopsis nevadensis TaxID=136037 RepID=A0A067RDK9_ZOONE|nr:glutamate receptor 1 isoform X2 [Zootermopsis nevadensis]XP_021922634.1 glutamate receptor 1 isoform X2 [Zootermopsis nevadensis]XP_021922635.1 glutamate receptor 1 isoform X2 [Zootermopsis nevadensis]KDR18055.1 hypothetical protein L798_07732 [Zootermopsis nevadensis]